MAPSLRSGEESTARLERLLERYASFLRGQIAGQCPRDLGIHVDDIEQEARLRLWRALEREKELKDPASYIYRIAVTATIDAVRSVLARREEQLHEHDDEDTPPLVLVADPIQAPDAVTERRELMSTIASAIATLGENRRRAVELHLQGLNITEIAELLEWTEPKVRSLVYRGLDDLREALRREGIEYP
jgi:RNA polymerase sigma-70 factor (ECF subfamily)